MRLLTIALLLAPLAAKASPCGSPVTITNRGEVMSRPRIHFVFWGSYWLTDGSAQADMIVRSYSRIALQYFSGLVQYGVDAPQLVGMTTATSYEPPSYVTQLDVAILLGTLKPMRGTYYVVLLPPAQTSPFRGFHTYLRQGDGSTIPFSWITNGPATIPSIFHELVEGMTDPEGRGVQTTAPMKSADYWSEIADACESACSLSSVEGVPVPHYWSQADGACIAPGSSARESRPRIH